MKSAEVQHIFESLKEQPTDDVISTRRFISSFVSSIRSSPIADNQEIDQIVSTFDPFNSGFIDFGSFEQGIEHLFRNAEDGSANQSKMMMSDTGESLIVLLHISQHSFMAHCSALLLCCCRFLVMR